MKKVLLNLSTASLAFLFGVSVQHVTRFEPIPTIDPPSIEVHLTSNIPFKKWEIDRLDKTEPSKPVEVETEEFFNGWYSVDDFKGMKDVWTMQLSRDYENEDNRKLVWSAFILTHNEENIARSFSVLIENNRLRFKTNKVKNTEYKFDGKFFKGKKVGKEGEKILRGTLRKFVKGKQVAAIKADFEYYEPRCWH
ncbi:MAG TPA: hypothetical protein VF571_03030 [Pyrinomonadaceae bacterium]|jgi:hypothetical protein